jgi:hypothetical protein
MPTYEEVLTLAKRLLVSDQARLLEALAVGLPHPVEVEGTDEISPPKKCPKVRPLYRSIGQGKILALPQQP